MTSKTKKRVSIRKSKQQKAKTVRTGSETFDLEKLVEHARQVEEQTTLNEVERRYALGVIVKSIHETYKETGIAFASAKLGKPAKTLYDYERLPAAWPDKAKFERMTAVRNKKGLPLEVTHYIALTYVKGDKERNDLRRQALDECLGAKEFRRLVHRGPAAETISEEAGGRVPVLCELMTAADGLMDLLDDAGAAIGEFNPDTLEPERRQLVVAADDKLGELEELIPSFRLLLSPFRAQEPAAAQ